MSGRALAYRDIAAVWHSQRGATVTLAVGVLTLGLLFNQEVAAAVHTWMDSTAYNHCFLVVPIAAYLVWDRRDTLRGSVAEPMPLAALAGIPLALVWLLAERLGIMEGRQLAAMSFLEVLAFAVVGPRLYWQLCGPLLYLYFLVPFGDFLTPKLQDITTDFVQHGLNLLHIPAYITGYTIEIPEGTFYIAQACAGLRFLIASIAFGALYSLLMYRSLWRRVAFMAASLVVPVIANGLRALGIVALGHVLGSAQAAATDHVLYGWIFFSIVILLLIMIGMPFREDLPSAKAPAKAPTAPPRRSLPAEDHWRSAALAGIFVLVLAAVSPAVAMQLQRASPPPAAEFQTLRFGPGCVELTAGLPPPLSVRARVISRRIACDGQVFDVQLAVLSTRSTAAPVLVAARELGMIPNPMHEEDFIIETVPLPVPSDPPRLWRLTRSTRPGPMVAEAIWVDGKPAAGGIAMRIHLARESLTGAPIAPVVAVVRPVQHDFWTSPSVAEAVRARLAALLAQAGLSQQVVRIAGGR